MKTSPPIDVAIIGAGLCGLACAAALERAGVEALVIERGNTAATAWRQRYRALRLISGRPFARLHGATFPSGTPMFPSREDMVAYLQAYADGLRTPPRTGVHIDRIDHRPDGPGWSLRSPQGDLPAQHVVVATGMLTEAVHPDWAGPGHAFGGRMLHSGEYWDPAPFRDARVLVVGGGTSGLDIADDLTRGGAAAVAVSIRQPPNILLAEIGGLPGDPAILFLKRIPPSLADALMKLQRRITLPDMTGYGLPTPEVGPFGRLAAGGPAPSIVDRDTVESLMSGAVRVVGPVRHLVADGAALDDGRHEPADAIILATGFRPGLDPLVGHLGVLDPKGRPHHFAGEESMPGLRFVGFDAGPGLIPAIRTQSRRVAREISKELTRTGHFTPV